MKSSKSKKGKANSQELKTPMKRAELYSALAESARITKVQVKELFSSLEKIIGLHIKKNGPQQFTLPGIAKIVVKHKPATKARKGKNPFTGEEIQFKAKPARNVVKIKPLGNLKAMV